MFIPYIKEENQFKQKIEYSTVFESSNISYIVQDTTQIHAVRQHDVFSDIKAIQKHDFVCEISNAIYNHGRDSVDNYDEYNNNHVDCLDVAGIAGDDDLVENDINHVCVTSGNPTVDTVDTVVHSTDLATLKNNFKPSVHGTKLASSKNNFKS